MVGEWDRALAVNGRVEFRLARWARALGLMAGSLFGAMAVFGLVMALSAVGPERGAEAGTGLVLLAGGAGFAAWFLRAARPGAAVVVTSRGVWDRRRRHVIAWAGIRSVEVVTRQARASSVVEGVPVRPSVGMTFVGLSLTSDEYAVMVATGSALQRLVAPLDRLLEGETVRLLPVSGASPSDLAAWLEVHRLGRGPDGSIEPLDTYYGRVRALVARMRRAGDVEAAQGVEDAMLCGATSGEVLGALSISLASAADRFPAHRTEAGILAGIAAHASHGGPLPASRGRL